MQTRTALISVSDRTNLIPFAKALTNLGFEILATSGSAAALTQAGVPVTPIDSYTQSPEILDGRVKTLHPKIHAGLLARMDRQDHKEQLTAHGMRPIEICVVNLYPFSEKVRSETAADSSKMIEFVDIGGPTMIRAAAKNHSSVLPVIDPADYDAVINFLTTPPSSAAEQKKFRLSLASKVFQRIAEYDLDIARYFSQVSDSQTPNAELCNSQFEGLTLKRASVLRYGENPHQKAAFYLPTSGSSNSWKQLQGKELSYNNLLDADAALRIISPFATNNKPVAVIVKHANPCGVADGSTMVEAVKRAKQCDPRSHFGGIIVLNSPLDTETAREIRGDFAEVVIAPSISEEAAAILAESKNLRVLCADSKLLPPFEIRSSLNGYLIQERDNGVQRIEEMERSAGGELSAKQLQDLNLAWSICANVKSNAIVLAKDGMVFAVGAGQMSRIDSVELALSKARTHGHDCSNAVAASDAFFPFPDGLETLIAAGVKAVVAPLGAKRDNEVLEIARKAGVTFCAAGKRHFRH